MKFPSAVFFLGLSASEVGLFAHLYFVKSRDYRVCITYTTLQRKLNVSRSFIAKSLKKFERKGLLSVVKRYFRYKDTFSHRNCYHLVSPMSSDPDLPLKEILSLPLSLDEKGLLLFIHYLSGEEGDTFMTRNEVLSHFKPKPHRAFNSLINRGYIKVSPEGVRVCDVSRDRNETRG